MLSLLSRLGLPTALCALIFTHPVLGDWSLTVQPSICTKSVFSYSTKLTVPTGQANVNFMDLGDENETWKFAADHDHNLTWLAQGGGPDGATGTRNKDGSYSLKTGGGSTPVMTECTGPGPKCNLSITNANLKCNKPVVDHCTTTHDTDISQAQWEAWKVDDFLEGYVANWTNNKNSKKKPFMEQFFTDFLGDNGQYMCSAPDDSRCSFPSNCDDIKTKGPYAMQAYQMLAGLENLSRVLSTTWSALGTAQSDLDTSVPVYVKAVTHIPAKPVSWQAILEVVAGIFTAMAVPVIALEGPAIAVGGLIGASTAFGVTGNAASINSDWQTEFMFENLAKDMGSLRNYISHSKTIIQNIHNNLFMNADHLVDVLKGGNWVSTGLMQNSLVNAKGNSNVTSMVSEYFDRIFITGLINQMFIDADVYITYVPYGQVKNGWGKTQSFTKADCEKDYTGKYVHEQLTYTAKDTASVSKTNKEFWVYCSDVGMAQFASTSESIDYDWYKFSFEMPGYTYHPLDVLKSSLSSFFWGGFGYNATSEAFQKLTKGESPGNLANFDPTAAGVFNVPVCETKDLSVNDWTCNAEGLFYPDGTCSGICGCAASTAELAWPVKFTDNVNSDLNSRIKQC